MDRCQYLKTTGRDQDVHNCTARGKQVRPLRDCNAQCPIIIFEAALASKQETSAMSADNATASPTGKKGILWDAAASESIESAPSDKPLWEWADEEIARRGRGGQASVATQLDISTASLVSAINTRKARRDRGEASASGSAAEYVAPEPVHVVDFDIEFRGETPALEPAPALESGPAVDPTDSAPADDALTADEPAAVDDLLVAASSARMASKPTRITCVDPDCLAAFIINLNLTDQFDMFARGWAMRDGMPNSIS